MARAPDRQSAKPGTLLVIATPIGNAGDLAPRAIKALAEANLIACEDTRRTGRMLAEHSIATPTISYFEHNEEHRVPELVERMLAGAVIALVTDAGTPAISDPGYRLVRAAHEAGVRVAPIPGASAAIAALSAAGLPTDRFAFEGFLPPRDSARRARLEELKNEPRTMVFYEAARRLPETLTAMRDAFGHERMAAVMRELTKTHEELIRASLGDLVRSFAVREVLGEVTIVVEGAPERDRAEAQGAGGVTIAMLIEAGLSLKQASAVIARATGRSRREVYQEALKSRGESPDTESDE
jgi:16S rRNA (cytidine1402-2'-O)-methyltransferase